MIETREYPIIATGSDEVLGIQSANFPLVKIFREDTMSNRIPDSICWVEHARRPRIYSRPNLRYEVHVSALRTSMKVLAIVTADFLPSADAASFESLSSGSEQPQRRIKSLERELAAAEEEIAELRKAAARRERHELVGYIDHDKLSLPGSPLARRSITFRPAGFREWWLEYHEDDDDFDSDLDIARAFDRKFAALYRGK